MSRMPWCEPGANFRESEKSRSCVIRNLDSFCVESQDLRVRATDKSFFVQGMNFVPEIFQQGCKLMGKILIELDLHRMCGTSGTGKSSSAEAAANAMAA